MSNIAPIRNWASFRGSFMPAFWGLVNASWIVLVKAIWPIQIGVLTVILGLMASVVPSIFAMPNLPSDSSINSPEYTVKLNIYSLLNLSIVFLRIILIGMIVNLLRTIWNSARKNATFQSIGPPSLFEKLFTFALEFICLFSPLSIIYYSVKSLNLTVNFISKELQLSTPLREPSDWFYKVLKFLSSLFLDIWYIATKYPEIFWLTLFIILWFIFILLVFQRVPKSPRL